MAKKITTGKRDREKQKQVKRQDKKKRKEERLNNSTGGSFEDMIAYVDENGMITSTPPDKSQKIEIDVENILISVPKRLDTEDDGPLEGFVDHFNPTKGYGFIKEANSNNKYFFHISNAPDNITEGNRVTFELEQETRGLNAVKIALVK